MGKAVRESPGRRRPYAREQFELLKFKTGFYCVSPSPSPSRLIHFRVVRSLGQELHQRSRTAHYLPPSVFRIFHLDEFASWREDKPSLLLDFSFKLALAPTCVADERPQTGPPFRLDVNVLNIAHETLKRDRIGPPLQTGECKVIRGDRSAIEQRNVSEGFGDFLSGHFAKVFFIGRLRIKPIAPSSLL